MCTDKKIETADELEFAVFCIENVAARLHVHAEAVYKAFTGDRKSTRLNSSHP